MKATLKKLLVRVLNWVLSARPIITTRDYTIQPASTGWYKQTTVNVALAGYTPISVGFSTNQVSCNLYMVSLTPSSNSVTVGRVIGSSGNTLTQNYVYLKVVYIKNSFQ